MGAARGALRGLSDENFPSNRYLMESSDVPLVTLWGEECGGDEDSEWSLS